MSSVREAASNLLPAIIPGKGATTIKEAVGGVMSRNKKADIGMFAWAMGGKATKGKYPGVMLPSGGGSNAGAAKMTKPVNPIKSTIDGPHTKWPPGDFTKLTAFNKIKGRTKNYLQNTSAYKGVSKHLNDNKWKYMAGAATAGVGAGAYAYNRFNQFSGTMGESSLSERLEYYRKMRGM